MLVVIPAERAKRASAGIHNPCIAFNSDLVVMDSGFAGFTRAPD